MRQIFQIFFKADDTKPFLVLLCLLIGGSLEAVGIGTLLPALSTLLNSTGQNPSMFERGLRSVLEAFNLTPDFQTLLLLSVTLLSLRAILLFGAMTYAGITGAKVANNLRRRLIKAVFEARWSYYAEQSSGRIASIISNDATRSGDAYNLAALAATNLIQIVVYAIVAFTINWRVAVLSIAGGLIIGIASQRLIKITKRMGYKQSDRTALLTSDMIDMVQNIKSLKAMHRYDQMIESLGALVRRLRRALYVQFLTKFGLNYGIDLLMVFIIAGAAWFAVEVADIAIQELIVVGVLFLQVISYISKFLKQMQGAIQVEASYVRTQEMIRDAEAQREIRTGTLSPPSRQDFTFDHVSFNHGDKQILIDVSLTIPESRITVLQGPSGAGKTTLIDLLIGLHTPQKGVIRIGQQPLAETDITAFRHTIGYVPQELALFHDTIRENISLSEPGITDQQIHEALQLAGAGDFIASLPQGLDTDVGEYGGKLSGGQRQRISLARALVRRPEILILDEVTSALDPETEAAIVDNIAGLRGRYTIIAITHRPAWTRIADVQYTFLGGRVTLTTRPNVTRDETKVKADGARGSKK
ncbi:ABC transporter ATP-binding protein [Aestuariivirga sp.]|uniref:ABC transporter ATP-binding protein n=1 Tax=Aestuariivirga sp. TaxID=2650926 RepID=UPI0039E595CC